MLAKLLWFPHFKFTNNTIDIIALIWKPFLIWLDNLFFHPLSCRVLGTQDTADKSLTGHKDLFILFCINKVIILQLFNLLDFNAGWFMSAARCFVRTEKHSLNSDLARCSSKPLTKVLSLFSFTVHIKPQQEYYSIHPWFAPPRPPFPATVPRSKL